MSVHPRRGHVGGRPAGVAPDPAARHAGARTRPKGKVTPKRGECRAVEARRRSRTRRREWIVAAFVAAALLAVLLAAGGGGGSGYGHRRVPVGLHG
jgi:hypothetical protein